MVGWPVTIAMKSQIRKGTPSSRVSRAGWVRDRLLWLVFLGVV